MGWVFFEHALECIVEMHMYICSKRFRQIAVAMTIITLYIGTLKIKQVEHVGYAIILMTLFVIAGSICYLYISVIHTEVQKCLQKENYEIVRIFAYRFSAILFTIAIWLRTFTDRQLLAYMLLLFSFGCKLFASKKN